MNCIKYGRQIHTSTAIEHINKFHPELKEQLKQSIDDFDRQVKERNAYIRDCT